jgi:hypothetical protein
MVCLIYPICPSVPFPYAPFGLAPCPAHTQRLFAEERDHQDCHTKARHRKQHLYNATGDFVPNNLDNNLDNNNVDIYLPGTVFHAPDSIVGCLLLACIEQAQEPLPPHELTVPVSHLLPLRLLIERIALAPGPHTSTCGVVPRLSHLNCLNQVLILKLRLNAIFCRLNPLFKWHGLFVQQPLDIQDRVHALGNQLKWCLENTHALANRPHAQYKAVLHRCTTIGHISFENYARNLPCITCNIADLSEQGYFGVFLNMHRG